MNDKELSKELNSKLPDDVKKVVVIGASPRLRDLSSEVFQAHALEHVPPKDLDRPSAWHPFGKFFGQENKRPKR